MSPEEQPERDLMFLTQILPSEEYFKSRPKQIYHPSGAICEKIRSQADQIKRLKRITILLACEATYWELHGSGSPREKSTPIEYVNEVKEELKARFSEVYWDET